MCNANKATSARLSKSQFTDNIGNVELVSIISLIVIRYNFNSFLNIFNQVC